MSTPIPGTGAPDLRAALRALAEAALVGASS